MATVIYWRVRHLDWFCPPFILALSARLSASNTGVSARIKQKSAVFSYFVRHQDLPRGLRVLRASGPTQRANTYAGGLVPHGEEKVLTARARDQPEGGTHDDRPCEPADDDDLLAGDG